MRGENTPERNRRSNSRPPGHESDTLTTEQPGRSQRETDRTEDRYTDRQTHKLYIHSPNLLNVRCCGTPTVPPNSPPPPITPPIPIPANPPAPGEVRTGAEKYTDNYFRALYLLRAVWKKLVSYGAERVVPQKDRTSAFAKRPKLFAIFVAFVEDNTTMSLIRYFENYASYFVQNRRK